MNIFPQLKSLKIISFILFVIFLFSLSPQTPRSSILGGLPFGGKITVLQPCNTGLLLYGNFHNTFALRYYWGASKSYRYGPPIFIGQNLLGMASAPTPCFIGPVPSGIGNSIMFHGSSGIGLGSGGISDLVKAGAAVAVGVAVLGGGDSGSGDEEPTSCSTAESGHMLIRGIGNLVYHPDTCNRIAITTDYETCTVTRALNGDSPSSPPIPVGEYTRTTDYFDQKESCESNLYACTTNDGKLSSNSFATGSIRLKDGSCVAEQLQCPFDQSRKLTVQNQQDTWNGTDAWSTSRDCGKHPQ